MSKKHDNPAIKHDCLKTRDLTDPDTSHLRKEYYDIAKIDMT